MGMPVREARIAWKGTLEQGTGEVKLVSSGLATYEVSFPKRAADDAQGTTSPEELIAAAHASCYAMQLSAMIAQAGGTPGSLDVSAAVTLGPDPAGGFAISGIHLTVVGRLEGLNPEQFAKVADDAKSQCPVSKALTGTTITLESRLA
jgi:osmotically inducible protein OsmC